MNHCVRFVQVGVGAIGRKCLSLLGHFPSLSLVGAVDADTKIAGVPLADLVSNLDSDVTVCGTYAELPEAQVALHSTLSSLPDVVDSLLELVSRGMHVVSSCEDLSAPYYYDKSVASVLDEAARKAGVVIVGAAVNPGYAMDLIPVLLSQTTSAVRAVRVKRIVDASTRRKPLQRKVGAGLRQDEFEAQRASLGHRGLQGSVDLVRRGLGWSAGEISESLEPVMAGDEVMGIHNVARYEEDGRCVELDLTMAVGAAPVGDTIWVDGEPPMELHFCGGIAGDMATCTTLLHRALVVATGMVPPGLRTVLDLPVAPHAVK